MLARYFGWTSVLVCLVATIVDVAAFAQSTTVPPLAPAIRLSVPTVGERSMQNEAVSLPQSLFQPIEKNITGGSTDIVFGSEASQVRARDVGHLLFHSLNADGIAAHQRTPIANDIRIRGSRAGQNIGAGSLWNPGRQDLDTALNKIFAYNIDQLAVIKGPYSVRFGPGFNYIDMQFRKAPIQETRGWGGMTSLDYETNGEIFYGRQQVWGGDSKWGVLVNYGHGTGNDYTDGVDFPIPASFKSRDLFVSLGHRISDDRHLEFSLIRLDQTDVEFPGLVFDINWLVTDGYELEYDDLSGQMADRFHAELWYNRTRFEGDTLRPSKDFQIPQLRTILFSPDGNSGFAVTDVDGSSLGGRSHWTWEENAGEFTLGTDFSYVDQTLNDIEPLLPPENNNLPIPHSNAWDIGLFTDYSKQVRSDWTMSAGARADVMRTRSSEFTRGVSDPATVSKDTDQLDQGFSMWATYVTSRYDVNPWWTVDLAAGLAQRPPTLTELYADKPFIGSLQQGLTFVDGDPELKAEKLRQIDASVSWNYPRFRGNLSGFYSWIEDYITYDLYTIASFDNGLQNGATFVNTDLATLSGFEANGEYDLADSLLGFAKISLSKAGIILVRRRLGSLRNHEVGS